jgi:hypothetical protein
MWHFKTPGLSSSCSILPRKSVLSRYCIFWQWLTQLHFVRKQQVSTAIFPYSGRRTSVCRVNWRTHLLRLASYASVATSPVKGKVIPVQAVEALKVARVWGSHIFIHSAHRWRQVCQPYTSAAFLPPGRFLVLIFVRGWVDARAAVLLVNWKNSPHQGLEPATFQFLT